MGSKEIKSGQAWKGSWDRPLKISEKSQHHFTITRMTDHNVRGRDLEEEMDAIEPEEIEDSEKVEKGPINHS